MIVLHSGKTCKPKKGQKVIFLAGPTKRRKKSSKKITGWRKKALKYLKRYGFTGIVVVPEPFIEDKNVNSQISWEQEWLERADKILFWVARDHANGMHASVTNLEFGQYVSHGNRKVTYGRPLDTTSISSNDWHANKNNIPIIKDLEDLIAYTMYIR